MGLNSGIPTNHYANHSRSKLPCLHFIISKFEAQSNYLKTACSFQWSNEKFLISSSFEPRKTHPSLVQVKIWPSQGSSMFIPLHPSVSASYPPLKRFEKFQLLPPQKNEEENKVCIASVPREQTLEGLDSVSPSVWWKTICVTTICVKGV